MHEAKIEDTETGRQPADDGWFILNLAEVPWASVPGGGTWNQFESPAARWPTLGFGVHILYPGDKPGFYHAESNQEGFLVLSGECLAIVEGEERRMGPWDFLHCPPGTAHILIGTGRRPVRDRHGRHAVPRPEDRVPPRSRGRAPRRRRPRGDRLGTGGVRRPAADRAGALAVAGAMSFAPGAGSTGMRFQAEVQLAGKTATGIVVPPEVVAGLGSGKRPPVRVTIGGHTYRSTIAPRGDVFKLGISAENRELAGVAAGDEVDVEIELDAEPREVTVPADFATALDRDAPAKRFFEGLSYSQKQWFVLGIEEAKTAETRGRRIGKAVERLREGRGNR